MPSEQYFDYRSYDNVEPFERGDSDHVIRIDGNIKAQVGTGTYFKGLVIDGTEISINLEQGEFGGPTEWPEGTKIKLHYFGAMIEPGFNTPEAKVEDIEDLHGLEVFDLQTDKDKEKMGYKLTVTVYAWEDGEFYIFYDHAIVEWDLPAHSSTK